MIAFEATVLGLPLHPLLVHAVVVLIPLAVLGLIASVLSPRLRERYGSLAVGFAVASFGFAMAAKLAGEELKEMVRLAEGHEEWGDRTAMAAFVMMVVGGAWWWLARRDAAAGRGPTTLARVGRVVTVLAALSALVMVALAGHSGAESVWNDAAAALSAYAG